MKSYLYIGIISLFISLQGFAQNDKTNRMSCTYYTLPSKPLPKDYTSYSISVLAVREHLNAINGSLRIGGYNLVNPHGDVEIVFEERPFNILKTEPQTREETVEKDGVKKKVYYYSYSFTYQHAIFLTVKGKDGADLLAVDLIANSYLTGKTPEYGSYKSASDNFSQDANKVGDSELTSALSRANGILNGNFGFTKTSFGITMYTVKPKKFNYDKFNQGSELAEKAIHAIDSLNKTINNPKDYDFSVFPETYNPYLDMLNQAISLWQDELKESNIEDRKARIDKELTLDLNLNIAAAYIVMNKFDDGSKYAKAAVALGRMNANSSYYEKQATDMKNMYHTYYPDKF